MLATLFGMSPFGEAYGELQPSNTQTTITYQCAPWDGVALGIQTNSYQPNSSRGRVALVLWGKGLRAAQVGQKVIVLDGHMSEEGTGSLSLCRADGDCRVVAPSRVELSEADIREHGTVKGTIVYRETPTGLEQSVPFHGVIAPSTFVCG